MTVRCSCKKNNNNFPYFTSHFATPGKIKFLILTSHFKSQIELNNMELYRNYSDAELPIWIGSH
jgi:hypothetical protein